LLVFPPFKFSLLTLFTLIVGRRADQIFEDQDSVWARRLRRDLRGEDRGQWKLDFGRQVRGEIKVEQAQDGGSRKQVRIIARRQLATEPGWAAETRFQERRRSIQRAFVDSSDPLSRDPTTTTTTAHRCVSTHLRPLPPRPPRPRPRNPRPPRPPLLRGWKFAMRSAFAASYAVQ
jgi:hypothetical protein